MKIEFENSIGREFFVPPTKHQSCLNKSLPTVLWVILGWFNKASVCITIKSEFSIFSDRWLAVKIVPVLLFYYGFDNVWGRYTPNYLASSISICLHQKESIEPCKKNWLHLCSNDGNVSWCIIWNPVFNMKCGIYARKVGCNIWDFEKTLYWYLLFAGSEVKRTSG